MDLEGVREHSLRQVRHTIDQHRMLEDGDTVLVAFSGGADSTALALILVELGWRVVLGHVDHGMRPGSDADARSCDDMARRLGLPLSTLRVSVIPPTEAVARDARYAALEQIREETGAQKIATGHTMDDDAETVAMRLDRGGLGIGIPRVRGHIVRPLLAIRRSQTEAICRERGVTFLVDPSNEDMRFARNRVRRQIRAAGPHRVEELVGIGRIAESRAARGRASAEEVLHAGEVTETMTFIPLDGLLASPPGVAEQVLRLVAFRFSGHITGGAAREVLEKVVAHEGARVQLGETSWAWLENECVVVGSLPGPSGIAPVDLSMGRNVLEGWGIEMNLSITEPAPIPESRYIALLDRAQVEMPLVVRSWEPGDRFHPLGAPGTKKLHDFFIDCKVPRRIRDQVPVLTSGGRIAWVVGHRIDDRFKVTASTSDAVKVSVEASTGERDAG